MVTAGQDSGAPWVKLAALGFAFAAVALAVYATPFGELLTPDAVTNLLEGARGAVWLAPIFVLAYGVATTFAIPSLIFTLSGGAVFSFGWAVLFNTLGANMGANGSFLLARYLGRDGVARLLGHRLEAIDRQLSEHGFLGILFLRLILIAPYNLLNLSAGLTAIKWRHYALATLLGMLPMTLVYTFFAGSLVTQVTEPDPGARIRLWFASALVGVLILVPIVARVMVKRRRARRDQVPPPAAD